MHVTRMSTLSIRLFFFCMYSEGDHDYIRRDRHLFSVTIRPLIMNWKKSRLEITRAFEKMERIGLIYNLTTIGADIKFALNPPAWLTFSEREKELRNCGKPLGNPAHVVADPTGDAASQWRKKGE